MTAGRLAVGLLVATLCLAACGDGEADAYRKEFHAQEAELRLRIQLHHTYHRKYPADLRELEDIGGYRLPKPPAGFSLHYDPKTGNAQIRATE